MLDWKKREGTARESVKEPKTQSRGYFKSILLSRSIAVLVAIFIVLLLLFNNFRDPVIILLMTPLIFIGVVVGLVLTGNQFDFFSLLGLLGLVGMNVKNGVILLDAIRSKLSLGVPPREAIMVAAQSRLLPVSLASITTILALIPLLFDSL
ncbi:MAG: efflux RND transporter permease subunit, partial [Pseudomonas sp.]|nr:efflux RND transporter permease subunit [Pseudomonas sp.]